MARINNQFYDQLGDSWYSATSHPVALLRCENRTRAPWLAEITLKQLGRGREVLDVGCGAGFLSNFLATQGQQVTGIDLSTSSLAVAQKHDATASVRYQQADAMNLPFQENSFDVVCAMDLLEHVENPRRVVEEAARVLRPGGLFFFHTFARNPFSYLLVIKGVEWFIQNTPSHMHIYSMFLNPNELQSFCSQSGLTTLEVKGLRPTFAPRTLFKLLRTRSVPEEFSFYFTRSLTTGYLGYSRKEY